MIKTLPNNLFVFEIQHTLLSKQSIWQSWTRLPLESRVIFVFFAFVAFFTDLRMAFFTA